MGLLDDVTEDKTDKENHTLIGASEVRDEKGERIKIPITKPVKHILIGWYNNIEDNISKELIKIARKDNVLWYRIGAISTPTNKSEQPLRDESGKLLRKIEYTTYEKR